MTNIETINQLEDRKREIYILQINGFRTNDDEQEIQALNKAIASIRAWENFKFDLNNYIDENGLEDNDIIKTVNYIINKHLKEV